jgi:hypothetical protein
VDDPHWKRRARLVATPMEQHAAAEKMKEAEWEAWVIRNVERSD